MRRFIESIQLRVFVLAVLIGLTLHLSLVAKQAKACTGLECVKLTGALCVGCLNDAPNGYPGCAINQDECLCENLGDRCIQ